MTTFTELGLNPEILQAIQEIGYIHPTEIQEKSLPILLTNDCDFIGLAQTGTGKTAAYGLPLLHKIDFQVNIPQAIILSPTRELCVQIAGELEKFAQNISNAQIACVYGGVSIEKQTKELNRGPQIIVATPGRMIDHLHRKNTNLQNIKYIVLDEADEMLNMGFREEVDEILSFASQKEKYIWLFSATMPSEIRQIINKFMSDPQEIAIGKKNTLAANIRNEAYIIDKDFRYEALKRIVDFYPDIYGIIFTRTKNEAQEVAEQLIKEGYNADALHGDLSQAIRDKVMTRFRDKSLQILVATDVAARGIDIDNITHVIHYGLPDDIESYIHRSGRTARAGKTGVSISIVTSSQKQKLKQIEQLIKTKIDIKPIPTAQDVIEKRLLHFFQDFKNIPIDTEIIHKYQNSILEQLQDLSREEILLRFCTLEFQRFTEYYKDAVDLNLLNHSKQIRLFINIGRKDGFDKLEFVQWLHRMTDIPKKFINNVRMNDSYSFFEISERDKNTVFERLSNLKLGKRLIEIEMANASSKENKKSHKDSSSRNKRNESSRSENIKPSSSDYSSKKKKLANNSSPNELPKEKKSITLFENFRKKKK
ncbi:MAG: DEAD/DEAH box helicase [Bacteroidia bacterium]|nr:MAG: DEAD/DEAH box helicase [Bacteroidia bacterium]